MGVFTEKEHDSRSKKLMRRFRKDIFSGEEGWLATALSYLRLNPSGACSATHHSLLTPRPLYRI